MTYKIVFMGTPKFSVPVLEVLENSSYKISCVYTQYPKKSNRGQKLNPSPIQKCAENLKLDIRSPQNLNNEEEFKFLKKLEPDIVVVVAYGQLIPKRFLDLSKEGFLNIHASLLPKFRGAAPIQRSIMNLEKETGISFMNIIEELDAGPVMKQIKIKVNELNTAEEISNTLSQISAENIIATLDDIFNKKSKFIEQKNELASYAKKIKKSETKINWSENAKHILAKINGLNSTLGAWFIYKNTRYKVWRAAISEITGKPGSILNNDFIIGCADKSIEITEIQKEGKNKLLLKDFLSGISFKIDDLVE